MIKSSRVTISNTAQKLSIPEPIDSFLGQTIGMKNVDPSATVYLGGSDVTVYNGFPLYAGEQMSIELEQPQDLYVITVATAELAVLWADVQ